MQAYTCIHFRLHMDEKRSWRRTKEATISLSTTNMQMQTDVANEQLPTRATTAGKTMELSNLYRSKRQVTSNAQTRKCNQRLNTRDGSGIPTWPSLFAPSNVTITSILLCLC